MATDTQMVRVWIMSDYKTLNNRDKTLNNRDKTLDNREK